MNASIQKFVDCKQIAVVGASRSGNKFGNSIVKELKERGYRVMVVHPEAEKIGEDVCYPMLADLAGKAEGVVICVPPAQTMQVLREAVDAGIRNIWLQQGAQSPEAEKLAGELGVEIVSGKCILMYAPPVKSFHGFHRGLVKLFGQL